MVIGYFFFTIKAKEQKQLAPAMRKENLRIAFGVIENFLIR